jgi:Raf kinase inhibitor-like YbhB/YbcL family protein
VIAGIVLAAATMTLQSADFASGGTIPRVSMAPDCGGAGRSPELHWSDAPARTKSFALIVRDPDAPVAGGFFHWVAYDIPATLKALPANAPSSSIRSGVSSAGTPGYYGPCPPRGPAHHYIFTLYALDVDRIDADTRLTAAQLEQRIGSHVLATATLTGTASTQ